MPLFVTALVQGRAALRADTLPLIIRDVVLGRLAQLDPLERRLMEVLAVAGDTGSAGVLAAVLEDDLDKGLRRLLTDALVTEQPNGASLSYRVAHPLYAEVVYAELTAAERRRLHARFAVAIDRIEPGDVLTIAPHVLGAGDQVDADRAVEVLAEAGWRALSLRAGEEAVEYLEAALRLANSDDVAAALLDGLGRAHQGLGNLEQASAAWAKGLRLTANPSLRNLLTFRVALLESDRGNPIVDAIGDAAADEPISPMALQCRSILMLRHGDKAHLRTLTERMLAADGNDHSPAARATAHIGGYFAAVLDNDFEAAHAQAKQALRHARECGLEAPMFISGADCLLIKGAVLAGEPAAALEYARDMRAEQAEFDMPSAVCYTNYCLASAHYFLGDLGTALAHSDIEIASARSINLSRALTHALLFRAFLLAEQGRYGEANACLSEAAGQPLGDLAPVLELAQTTLASNAGTPEQAPPLVDWSLIDEGHLRSVRILYGGYAAIALGDHDQATMIIGRLRELGCTAPFLDTLADHLEGLRAGKPELLRIAADRLDTMDMPVLAAQAHLHWAELVGDEARDAVARCLEVFAAAGTIPWLDRTRRLARTLGIRVPAPRRPGVLSNRETQIVGLVGSGLSNADIAARLFLSERTVETHLRNSYAKLGLNSRVALAQWATQELGPMT